MGLENKVADALYRVPPTTHLNHILAPALLDLAIIQDEVEKDPYLQDIKTKREDQKQEISDFSIQQGVLKYKGRLVLLKTSVLFPCATYMS